MKILTNPKRKKLVISLLSALLAFSVITVGFFIYVSNYYHADEVAIETHKEICEGYANLNFPDEKTAVFSPESATVGLIFYPGGKVEFSAYLPLMAACAERGILCVLVEMPFNLAVLDVNAANGIRETYPEIEHWYIGGHSLGGSMAATYVESNCEYFNGLVLLGAYSTSDLSALPIEILSIYGSEDGVMNREKYEKYKPNIQGDLEEHVIDGGSHAYFGVYGNQNGDGVATITNEEQINITAEIIAKFIFE